jgi:hypothetical protein
MATAFGHLLEDLTDGVTVFREGVGKPMPLASTSFDIDITAGLATVVTTRTFCNQEDVPIEAILTMPVGFNAVVTGLSATIDGRVLRAVAEPKAGARDRYEAAIDQGKMAVLHEEALRGLHVLSIGQLAPGKTVAVELRTVLPLSATGGDPLLRVPVTVGQLYGSTPLQPADDLITDASVRHRATLRVRTDSGAARLAGAGPLESGAAVEITLDRAIEISVTGEVFGTSLGVSGLGHHVRVDLRPQPRGDRPVKIAVLIDRSGSTASPLADRTQSVLSAMRAGLEQAFSDLAGKDHVSLWQFSNECQHLGSGWGTDVLKLLKRLNQPAGGTNLGQAIRDVAASGAQDILVLTDGQTWDALPPLAAELKIRVSAVLVGKGSLDVNIGHLCAMTSGELLYAPGADVAGCVRLALDASRATTASRQIEMSDGRPQRVTRALGGIEITAHWSGAMEVVAASDIGRFAAGLCLGLLPEADTQELALREGLCSHATSLVLVDQAGEVSKGLSETRKVPLSDPEPAVRHSMRRQYSGNDGVLMYLREERPLHRIPDDSWATVPLVEETPHVEEAVDPVARAAEAERENRKHQIDAAYNAIWPKNLLRFHDDDPVVIRWTERKQQETRACLQTIADGIDWASLGNRFLLGDYGGLSSEAELALTAMEQHESLQEVAANMGVGLRSLMIAYLAVRFAGNSRHAVRFAAKATQGFDDAWLARVDVVIFPVLNEEVNCEAEKLVK